MEYIDQDSRMDLIDVGQGNADNLEDIVDEVQGCKSKSRPEPFNRWRTCNLIDCAIIDIMAWTQGILNDLRDIRDSDGEYIVNDKLLSAYPTVDPHVSFVMEKPYTAIWAVYFALQEIGDVLTSCITDQVLLTALDAVSNSTSSITATTDDDTDSTEVLHTAIELCNSANKILWDLWAYLRTDEHKEEATNASEGYNDTQPLPFEDDEDDIELEAYGNSELYGAVKDIRLASFRLDSMLDNDARIAEGFDGTPTTFYFDWLRTDSVEGIISEQ